MADFYDNDNKFLFPAPKQNKYQQTSQELNEILQNSNEQNKNKYEDIIKEREQRAINQNKYGVDVPDNVYEILNYGIANNEIPEDAAYNMATAYKYSEMYGVPLEMAMENIDHYNELTFGTKRRTDAKGNFEAVCDSWQIGKNTLEMASLGAQLKEAERLGNTELVANIEQRLSLLEQENNSLADNQNRNFFIKALKDGAQTLPYSGAVAIPGILNAFLPGLGTAAAGVTSAELASSLEYVKLRQAGVTSDIARNISSVSGVVQGATEMALGTVAKSLGTNKLGKLVGSKTDDVVKSVLNKMHISNAALNKLGTALTNYAMDATEEGLEEALQEFESYVGLVIAEKIQDETDGQVQVPDIQEFVNDAIASFGAGFRSSLILGGLSNIPQGVAKIADAEKLKQAAQTIPSKEEFINVTNNSPVFEGMTAEEKKETQEEIYSTFEKQRNEILDTKAKDIEEVSDFQEGSENDKILEAEEETEDVRGKAYRTESGRLYTETDTKTDEKGNVTGTFKIGNPEEETSYNRYGYIKFTETSDNVVTIDSFKVTPGRQNLTVEMFEEFAEQNADKDIVWNPKGKLAKSLYKQLALNNPRGKEYGLSYYQDKSSSLIQDRQARVKLAKDIQKYFPNMNSQERATSITIFESMAKSMNMGLDEYIKSTYKDGNPFADFSESGQKDVIYDENGKASYRLGAMTTFKNDAKSLIYTTQHSNFSTFVHENAHVYRAHMTQEMLKKAEEAFGVKNGDWNAEAYKTNDGRTISYEEAFAEGFEDYLRTGQAKNTALKEIYQAIAQFMQRIYAYMQGQRINISKDIKDVYDSMLSGESSLMNALSAVQQADESYQGKVNEEIKAEQEKKTQKETLTKQQEVEKIINDDTVAQQEKVTEVLNFVSEEELEKEYENLTEPDIPNFIFQTISDEGLERLLVDDPKLQQKHRLAKIAIENEYPSYYFSREDVPFSLIDGKLVYETDDSQAHFTQEKIFNVLKEASNNRINEFYNAYLEKKNENKEESLKYLKNAKLLKFAQENVSRQNFTLKDVLVYNDLYKAYPWLKSIPVRFISEAVTPLIDVTENEITINPVKGTLEEALTDLLVKTQLIINKTQALYNKDGSKFDAELDKNIQKIVDKYREKQEVIAKYNDIVNAVYENVDKNDIHYQVIGEIGAKALDIAEESNIRLDNLSIARQMKEQGKDALTIRLATGWEKGVDEQWKYEIDDTKLKTDFEYKDIEFLKNNPRYEELEKKMFNGTNYDWNNLSAEEQREYDELSDLHYEGYLKDEATLPEILDAPEIFNAYPQLKKLVVKFSDKPGLVAGQYKKGKIIDTLFEIEEDYNQIDIFTLPNSENAEIIKSTLLHEIQHAIQRIEGFAKGGNIDQFAEQIKRKNPLTPAQEKLVNDVDLYNSNVQDKSKFTLLDFMKGQIQFDNAEGIYDDDFIKSYLLSEEDILYAYNQAKPKLEKYLIDLKNEKSPYDRYYSLAGEVEARNVQNRMYMTSDERRKKLLQDTADVAPVDQLVLFQSVSSDEFNAPDQKVLFQEVEEASLNIPEKTKIDRDNFFKNTHADWKIAKTPDRQYDYKSASGSEYWYEKDGVYRRSNHWGNVASCRWYLEDEQYQSMFHDKSLSFEDNKKYSGLGAKSRYSKIGIEQGSIWWENSKSKKYALTGFSKWDDFEKMEFNSAETKEGWYQNFKLKEIQSLEDFNESIQREIDLLETEIKRYESYNEPDFWNDSIELDKKVISILKSLVYEEYLKTELPKWWKETSKNRDTINFQTAYHGTPHNFDRFSTSAIGTGEGTQAFGWGLYFTNQEDIARWYADKLSPVKVKKEYYIIKDYIEVLYREVFINNKDFTGEKKDIEKTLERELEAKKDMGYPPYVIKDLENELNLFSSISDKDHLLTIIEPSRHLYTVDLPDNGYLLWDKIVNNDELEKIKKALKEKGINDLSRIENLQGYQEQYKNNENATYTIGSNIYKVIADYLGSDKAASLFLRENGYIGIDYPANSIAGHTDEDKRNYVIFDENDVEITNHINYQTVDEDFLFQTEQELMKEAASFDTWQEFMEYYENPAFRPNNAHVPSDANASWYQKTWELAKGLVPTESLNREEYLAEQEAQTNDALSLDAMFLTELKNDNMLEPFLKAIAYYKKTDEWQPVDAEDNEELERFKRIKNRVEYEIRHASFITNATRVMNGKPLTKRARESILSLIEKNARDYRSLYADIMYKDEYAVKLADTNKGKVKIASPDIDVDVMPPEQLKEIADKIEFEELAKKIKSGELLMDDELNRYINMLDSQLKESNKKLKEAEKAIEDERNEQSNDYKRISDWQQRQLLKYYDELLEAKGKLYEKDKRNLKVAERGLKIAQPYQLDMNRRQSNYDTIFKQFQDMKKITEITGGLKEAIARRDILYEVKTENKKLKEMANALDETREIQKKLVKRAMRKIDFKNVDYDNAVKIVTIQELFEPLLLEGLNKWIDTDNPYLRTVYYDYKTDADFRESLDRLAGNKNSKNLDYLIYLIKTKDFDSWTPEEIKKARKGLPKKNYIKEFGVESLGRYRKGSIQLDLQSEETKQMLKDTLPPDILGALSGKDFVKWTINEMAELVEVIDDLYQEGRTTLKAKEEAKKRESRKIREKIEEALRTGGIEIPPDATEEEKEKYQKLIDKRTQQILGYENVVQGTLDAQNNKNSLFNRLRHRGYADATVLRVARILDGDKEGTNTDLLYYRADESYNSKHKNIRKRQAKIDKALIDNNIKVEELYKQITIPNLIDNKDTSFTIDELLFFLAANEDKPATETEKEESFNGGSAYEAVVYGNMASNSEKTNLRDAINNNTLSDDLLGDLQTQYKEMCENRFERVLAVAKQLEPKFLNFANAIQDDYAVEFERINKASIEEFNQPVWRVEKYIPLIRLGQSGDVNENRVKEDLLGTSGMQNQNWVNKGMTQKRIRINPWNQRPVETGLYKTWLDSVDRTEHFIAYSGYVRELNRIYKSRDANGNRGLMEAVFGKGMVRYIDDYINELANPTPSAQRTSLDKICRTLRGKTAPAYLAWKISGIVKQFCTSPWPFLQYITPGEYINACLSFINDYNNMADSIKNKSVFMNSRTMDPVIDLIKEEQLKVTNKAKAGLNKFNSTGMKGLEMVDWMCVAPGWLASYRKEYNKLTSEIANQEKAREDAYKKKLDELIEENEKLEYFAQKTMEELQEEAKMDLPHVNTAEEIEELAVRKADDITRRCQPSSRAEDLSPLFKNSGKNSELVKILLQFQTSLNVIWNNIRYDLPQAVKERNYRQAVFCIAGYAMAGIMVTLVTGGPYGDEEDDEETKLLKQIMFGATTQFTDSVPVLGSYITTLSEMLITGEGGMMYSNNTFPVLNEAMATVQSASKGKWDKAAINFAEGVGYFLGLPVSGTKELLESAGLRDDEEGAEFKPGAFLGWR